MLQPPNYRNGKTGSLLETFGWGSTIDNHQPISFLEHSLWWWFKERLGGLQESQRPEMDSDPSKQQWQVQFSYLPFLSKSSLTTKSVKLSPDNKDIQLTDSIALPQRRVQKKSSGSTANTGKPFRERHGLLSEWHRWSAAFASQYELLVFKMMVSFFEDFTTRYFDPIYPSPNSSQICSPLSISSHPNTGILFPSPAPSFLPSTHQVQFV